MLEKYCTDSLEDSKTLLDMKLKLGWRKRPHYTPYPNPPSNDIHLILKKITANNTTGMGRYKPTGKNGKEKNSRTLLLPPPLNPVHNVEHRIKITQQNQSEH